jgi:hypothetical protein
MKKKPKVWTPAARKAFAEKMKRARAAKAKPRKMKQRVKKTRKMSRRARVKNPSSSFVVSAGRTLHNMVEVGRFKMKSTALWFAKKYHALLPREYIKIHG